jgi:hypothetical protein
VSAWISEKRKRDARQLSQGVASGDGHGDVILSRSCISYEGCLDVPTTTYNLWPYGDDFGSKGRAKSEYYQAGANTSLRHCQALTPMGCISVFHQLPNMTGSNR